MASDEERDYVRGEQITLHDFHVVATVTGERCWQCKRVSVVNYMYHGHAGERCLNGCGPRGLVRMLQFK